MIRRALILAAAALTAFAPAAAQPPADSTPAVVEELVARAYGGLAWWKVTDRDTTVWILAIPPASIPKGVTIDTSSMERRLRGANALIVPATGRNGIALSSRAAFNRLVRDLNANTKDGLEPTLPPEVRARFAAAREKIGQPATRYGALPPGLAGMALAGDISLAFDKANPVVQHTDLMPILAAAAKRSRVRMVPAAIYDGFGGFLREARRPGVPCLVSVLDFIDAHRAPTAADLAADEQVFRAWMDGDVRPGLERMKGMTWGQGDGREEMMSQMRHRGPLGTANIDVITGPCLKDIPSHQRIVDGFLADHTNAVRSALRKKGHAVAVFYAAPLLVRGGVLDQLRREGYTVTTPAGT